MTTTTLVTVGEVARRGARRIGLTRARIAAGRMYCERTALAIRPGRQNPVRGRILCYHSVGQPAYGVNDVTPQRFREHLEIARAEGYRFVPAEHIAATGGEPGDLAITFDDGLRSVLDPACSILERFGAPATCFVVSSWPDHEGRFQRDEALGWDGLRRLLDAGVAIGSHSVNHPDFAALDADEARTELVASRRRIEDRLGIDVHDFAIPFGQSANWTGALTRLANDVGYRHVYAQSQDRRAEGTVARTFVTRFDDRRRFLAALAGAYDRWEEWY